MTEVQKKLNYVFKNPDLLRQCFTHSSYSNEHKTEKDNERLEFLGDSVLGLVVSEYLFKTKGEDEGCMTADKQKIVSTKPLAAAARKLNIDVNLITGSENTFILTDKVCENLFESVIAGIYLDGGFEEAKKFIYKNLIGVVDVKNRSNVDYKSELNEYCSKRKLGLVTYTLNAKTGSEHKPTFKMAVIIKGKQVATGEGGSKKVAEQAAAENAFKVLSCFKASKKQKNKASE